MVENAIAYFMAGLFFVFASALMVFAFQYSERKEAARAFVASFVFYGAAWFAAWLGGI